MSCSIYDTKPYVYQFRIIFYLHKILTNQQHQIENNKDTVELDILTVMSTVETQDSCKL